MDEVKALVLCGGKGKRLRPITYYLQKTMIPVGAEQKPLLEYIIRLLGFHNLDDITLLVNYKAEQIKNFFGDGARFGVKIRYVHDTHLPSGTGGSIINAYSQKIFDEKNVVLIYYGDIITNLNLKELIDFHKKKNAAATIALSSGFQVRVGLAELEEDSKIRAFIEKPKLEKPVSIGILVFEGSAFNETMNLLGKKRTVDLMGDIIPLLIRTSKPVYGFVSNAFWYDVGSIEAYEKLNQKKMKENMAFLF